MRLVVMADGRVGRAIIDFLTREHPNDLVAVVVTSALGGSVFADEIRELAAGIAPVTTWDNRESLRCLASDVLLLAWWPYLLKDSDLSLSPTILNMHPSLLPHCRGKDPNFWTLVEERPFGVTLHHVEASIDGGPIAFQRPIATDWTSTGRSLYEHAEVEMERLFVEHYSEIAAGRIPRIPQPVEAGSRHMRAELDAASMIDLDAPTTARKLLNLLRARTFPPHPACRFVDKGVVYEARIEIRRFEESRSGLTFPVTERAADPRSASGVEAPPSRRDEG